ncbi:hypothetical protein WJX72_007044 [[Myrmecia] bisecta]|uniref:Ubiquitin-like domain-containing protein n=1 Tax=[Myrmecia] bisecta TaxID=41462 RepID=A0AAW1R8C7_9CHLO
MQVFVRTVAGKTIAVNVDSSELVGSVKIAVQGKEGVPAHQQGLVFEGKQLEEGRCLAHYNIRSESTLHMVSRLRGGKLMQLTIRPRIQKDKWSLYWKESMETKTELLEEYTVQVDSASTVTALQKEVSQKLKWEPVDNLLRLEGFKDPWEFSVYKGRMLKADATLEQSGITADAPVITVRRVLVAEGWKIVTGGDEDSSSDEDDF